jgi:hypothetical protein
MAKKSITDEGQITKDCILHFFIGKRIGKGAYRHVYRMNNQDSHAVIKVEYCGSEFCNITEWKVWNAVKDTPLEPWFAPCINIDLMGVALIQQRTKPFESEKEFHTYVEKHCDGKLPSFFDDIHYGNFGIYEDRLVCHDYGFNHFLDEAVRMKWEDVVHKDVKHATTTKPVEEQLAFAL